MGIGGSDDVFLFYQVFFQPVFLCSGKFVFHFHPCIIKFLSLLQLAGSGGGVYFDCGTALPGQVALCKPDTGQGKGFFHGLSVFFVVFIRNGDGIMCIFQVNVQVLFLGLEAFQILFKGGDGAFGFFHVIIGAFGHTVHVFD